MADNHAELIERLENESVEDLHGYAAVRVGQTMGLAAEALRDLAAERDKWMEDARMRAGNTDYWREKCQHHMAERDELLRVLAFAAHKLEGARIWNGMGWHYNPLHPVHYKPALERINAALASGVEK